MSEPGILTKDEARRLALNGWNLRCNLCGSYGARWLTGERPGWGSLALCEHHAHELHVEKQRHDKEMRRLRTINFEQDIQRPNRIYEP